MTSQPPLSERGCERLATEAASLVRDRWPQSPRAAIVLGTGLGGLAARLEEEASFDYAELPGFPRPTALAHQGRLVCGSLAGVPIIALQGRVHYYEGYDFDTITLPVQTAAAAGCETLVVSNASGGLNPQFATGDVMAIDSHIDLMGARNANEAVRSETSGVPRRLPSADYDESLALAAQAAGRQQGFDCHRGVYVAVTGPSYETRAEYRMMRRIGGDAVGMSTVPETVAARAAGMRVLGLSTITNVARPDAPTVTDAQDVVDVATQAEAKLLAIVTGVLSAL